MWMVCLVLMLANTSDNAAVATSLILVSSRARSIALCDAVSAMVKQVRMLDKTEDNQATCCSSVSRPVIFVDGRMSLHATSAHRLWQARRPRGCRLPLVCESVLAAIRLGVGESAVEPGPSGTGPSLRRRSSAQQLRALFSDLEPEVVSNLDSNYAAQITINHKTEQHRCNAVYKRKDLNHG